MEILLDNTRKRSVFVLIACVVSAVLIFQALELWIASRQIDSGRLDLMQRGAALLPGNAEAWDRVGHFWQYDFAHPDSAVAIQNYQKALRDDPNSSYYWMDLASAYEDVGDLAQAQRSFEKAQVVYPASAFVLWNYGNYLVRRQEYSRGYEKIRQAVAADPKLLPLAISRTWRASESVDDLLNKALPGNTEAYLQTLAFFTSINQPDAGLQVWSRLIAVGKLPALSDAFSFLDNLIANDRADDARRVWREALSAAGVSYASPANRSLMWNGDFARDFARGGFDWRWNTTAGVEFSLDSPAPLTSGRSVRLDFSGGSNLAVDSPAQFVPVDPGRVYHFHAYLRTRQITTESGMQISITDPNHRDALDFVSENFTGSHPWTSVDGDVTTGPRTHFLVVRFFRNPSRFFDNKLDGTAWLGDISLVPSDSSERPVP
jgi:tetratricopeptide (TPR) repeat protein